jgi:hypothetical protein
MCYAVTALFMCYGVMCTLCMLHEVPHHLPVGPEPAMQTYNTVTAHINCCQYITHCENPTI